MGVAAIDVPGGFLFEWQSVFWDIHVACTNEEHSEVAAPILRWILMFQLWGVSPTIQSAMGFTIFVNLRKSNLFKNMSAISLTSQSSCLCVGRMIFGCFKLPAKTIWYHCLNLNSLQKRWSTLRAMPGLLSMEQHHLNMISATVMSCLLCDA